MKKKEKSITITLKGETYLTKKKYTRLLRLIGLSQKPMSSYEIKQEYKEKYKNTTEDDGISDSNEPIENPHNYIYKMIEQLTPNFVDELYKYGFNWDEIIENRKQQNRVLDYISKYFKIDLKESSSKFEKPLYPIFSKSNDGKIIKIEIQSKVMTLLIKKTAYLAEVILKDTRERILQFKVKNDTEIYFLKPEFRSGSFSNFMNLFFRKRPYFLDIEYETKNEKNIELQHKEVPKEESLEEYMLNYENKTIDVHEGEYTVRKPLKDYVPKEIYEYEYELRQFRKPQNESQNMKKVKEIKKYSLNIRGLILYILGEVNSNEDNSSKNRSKYRQNISKVLENLSQNYSSNFPFLFNYKRFKKIFEKVTKSKNLSYYEVEVLIIIAKELKTQILIDERFTNRRLDSNNDNLIYFLITTRYFSEMYHYFGYLSMSLDDDKKNEFINLFGEYQKRMLILMEEYLEKEQKSVGYLQDEFNRNNLTIS